MMNVQTMRHLVDRLAMGEMPDEVETAVRRWHGKSLSYVRSSANHIFKFLQDGQIVYLRLAHERERGKAVIEAELDFILHCSAHGLAVARPVLSTSGTYIEEIVSQGELYYAVVFEGLPGAQYEIEDLDESMYRVWGNALGRLHQASRSFPPHPARLTWQDEIQSLLTTLPPEEHTLAQVLESGLIWLKDLPGQEVGFIHGDFELDNLVWDGERVQILDFDAGTYTCYAADIAIALQDLYVDGTIDHRQELEWFLNGYADVCPPPSNIRENIFRFLELLLAAKIAGLLRSYATTTDDDLPAWLANMRNRHQSWFRSKRALLGGMN